MGKPDDKRRDDYERMSKEELLRELDTLLADRKALQAGELELADRTRLVHELRVHQVELEAQNRHLRDTQQDLETSRARYADLYEAAPMAYFTVDEHGQVQEVNAMGAAMLGRPAREIVGVPFLAMVRCAKPSVFSTLVWQCLHDRKQIEAELGFAIRPGRIVWAHVRAHPVLDHDGRAVACRMAFADVTRLKNAEADLAKALLSERRLRARLDAISHAHATVSEAMLGGGADIQRVLQAVADEARALVQAEFAALGLDGGPEKSFAPWVFSGLTEEQERAIGRHPLRVGVLDAAASGAEPLRLGNLQAHPAFRGFPANHPPMRAFLGVPIRYRGRSIGTLYAATTGAREFTGDDEQALALLAQRVAISLEIARLRDVEARGLVWLREVVEQMPEAVLLVGEDGEGSVSCNAAAKALFGASVEAFTPAGAPVPPEELPHVRASRGETTTGLELQVRRPDGTLAHVVVNAAPVQDGRPASAVAVFQDVTAARRLEQEREEWTSVVAHDLRQPATVISFAAQFLARYSEGLGPREVKHVGRISSAVHALSRMIDDLLEASLIDTRRLKLKLAPVDLGALAREVVDRLRPGFGDHEVRVQAEDVATVLGDHERLAQVVTNLLTNALKYSEPASAIDVRVARDGGEAVVGVTNRGRGIGVEDLARLFQRFYRTKGAGAGGSPGLGLGLYIAKGLVEAHGGRIAVESIPGETTTFRLFLTLRSGDD